MRAPMRVAGMVIALLSLAPSLCVAQEKKPGSFDGYLSTGIHRAKDGKEFALFFGFQAFCPVSTDMGKGGSITESRFAER